MPEQLPVDDVPSIIAALISIWEFWLSEYKIAPLYPDELVRELNSSKLKCNYEPFENNIPPLPLIVPLFCIKALVIVRFRVGDMPSLTPMTPPS